MYLHSYEQLLCVKKTPPLQRIVHFDASGGLVKITKKKREYQRMLNYVLLLKDSKQLDLKAPYSVPIAEMASRSHGTYRISDL
jgi:hypothetical protein